MVIGKLQDLVVLGTWLDLSQVEVLIGPAVPSPQDCDGRYRQATWSASSQDRRVHAVLSDILTLLGW